MTVEPPLAGRSFPPTAPYLVGREKIREFARAVHARNPLHFDVEAARAAGYADVVAPPTFAILIQGQSTGLLIAAEPDNGLEMSRIVHTEQRFSYERPIVAGDELTSVMSVAGVRKIGGNTMISSLCEVTDATGALVVSLRSSILVRGEGES